MATVVREEKDVVNGLDEFELHHTLYDERLEQQLLWCAS